MEIHLVVAPVFGTNCCVVVADDAPGGPRDCVVVDAGAGVEEEVSALVTRLGLRPRAVLATHGHVDHTWDAATLCERYGVPMRVHAADAYRLTDPFGTLGISDAGVSHALGDALAATGRRQEDYRAPGEVKVFEPGRDDETLVAGAVRLRAVHAPGHTEGSTLFVLGGDGDGRAAGPGAPSGVVLAGDVLFAGGVGRTDLPGGDAATMRRTLRDVVGRLDRDLAVVPGHGPTTRVGHELDTNPFLA
ncbi:MBL fold metallo-hydrolase [Isoptericola sp. NEAU-Y5]|uniref:MBL fold metallo-hydrolase n=1 Tax=Isoptericola luteus TaxID=2879484 RepID=A0ABS7ZJN3_9MICO|nr:MBL fold metallo-hydrolase [Isoptericola sp. NEAU-Y5]MCA5894049.1 MBL fold metallo-hydrolase [Isoptericola sp. NEAU-Y5]